jgi:hypothetical protein
MDSEQLIDPVIEHLKVLLKTNVPEAQLSAVCKLLNIEPTCLFFELDHVTSERNISSYLAVKKINRSKPKENKGETEHIDVDGYYIEPNILSCTPRVQTAPNSHCLIQHKWKEGKEPKVGGDDKETVNTSTYVGDTVNLITCIWQMLPRFDSAAKVDQMTILLPFSNSFDAETFTGKGKGWEVFNLIDLVSLNSESEIEKKTLARDINFLSMFNLLGLNDDSIKKLLYKTVLAGDEKSPFKSIGKVEKRERIPGFYLTDNRVNDFKSLIKRDDKYNESLHEINALRKVIHRMKLKDKSFAKLGALYSLQENDSEGSAIQKDLSAIRKGLSYFMSHSSGVAITINIPRNPKARGKLKPTLFMPSLWKSSINGLRLATTKRKALESTHNLLKLENPNSKITVEDAIKLAKYLGIAETKKEVEKLAGHFTESFKFVDINDSLQGDTLTFCQEMFAQMLSDDFVKNDFPIRYFPNPEIYGFIKKVNKEQQ